MIYPHVNVDKLWVTTILCTIVEKLLTK